MQPCKGNADADTAAYESFYGQTEYLQPDGTACMREAQSYGDRCTFQGLRRGRNESGSSAETPALLSASRSQLLCTAACRILHSHDVNRNPPVNARLGDANGFGHSHPISVNVERIQNRRGAPSTLESRIKVLKIRKSRFKFGAEGRITRPQDAKSG
jgi:hypothetical protein